MIKSMTGYGKSSCRIGDKVYTVEVKTLNSKFLDLNMRIPFSLKEKDIEVRKDITTRMERGKIDLTMGSDTGGNKTANINRDVAKSYYDELSSLANELGAKDTDIFNLVMKFPEITSGGRSEISDDEYFILRGAIDTAIDNCDEFRRIEGKQLEKELKIRSAELAKFADEIELIDPDRMERMRARLMDGLADVISKNRLDENRLEQELIFYVEKLDVTEEKVRLRAHIKYFDEMLGASENTGKKLGFITQEMGREVNTIGSKANDAQIQKIVVQMKDGIEKIKEQLLNIL